jgi:hypothetical protein
MVPVEFHCGDALHVEVRQRDVLWRLRLVADSSLRAEEMALLNEVGGKIRGLICAKYGSSNPNGLKPLMDRICDSDTASGRANQAVLDIAARLRACLTKNRP